MSKQKPKVLVVAPIIPYPLHDGDKHRLYHLLRELSVRHDVSLLACTRETKIPRDLGVLSSRLKEVTFIPLTTGRLLLNLFLGLFSSRPFNVSAFQWGAMRRAVAQKVREGKFDLLFAYRLRMAPYLADLPQPKVLDYTDALSLYIPRLADATRNPFRKLYLWIEGRRLAGYEPKASAAFNVSFISSPLDQAQLSKRGAVRLRILSNGIDTASVRPRAGRREPRVLLFTGNMGYTPNQQAVIHFMEEIWPLIRQQEPSAVFRVAGGNVPDWMMLLSGMNGVEFTGRVPDMRPFLHKAALFVCPLRTGSGVRFKILEAWAAGLPVLSTLLGCEGLPVRNGRELVIADTPAEFAEAAVRLLRDPAQRARLARAGLRLCRSRYDWRVIGKGLNTVLKGFL